MYVTLQIWIKSGHRLFSDLKCLTENSKNLYNTTNFYIRQIYTALKTDKSLHPLQQEVMNQLHVYLPIMNENQQKAYQKRLKKQQEKPEEERKKNSTDLI